LIGVGPRRRKKNEEIYGKKGRLHMLTERRKLWKREGEEKEP